MHSSSDLWATFRDICARLDVISSARTDCKINIDTLRVESKSWFTSFVRTFVYPQSRYQTVEFINSTIERCVKFAPHCDIEMRRSMHGKLEAVRTGLEYLRQTYRSDPVTCAHLTCCDVMLSEAVVLCSIE